MANGKEVGVQWAPGEGSDGHLPGLVVAEPPEREESATPLLVVVPCILIVLEVWGGGTERGMDHRYMYMCYCSRFLIEHNEIY